MHLLFAFVQEIRHWSTFPNLLTLYATSCTISLRYYCIFKLHVLCQMYHSDSVVLCQHSVCFCQNTKRAQISMYTFLVFISSDFLFTFTQSNQHACMHFVNYGTFYFNLQKLVHCFSYNIEETH